MYVQSKEDELAANCEVIRFFFLLAYYSPDWFLNCHQIDRTPGRACPADFSAGCQRSYAVDSKWEKNLD